MRKLYNIDTFDLLICLSEITDWISPELNNHHIQVAMMSVLLAKALKLDEEEINDVACAAILHDIGAISLSERIKLVKLEEEHPQSHAELGYKLLKMFKPLERSALAVKYHHTPYSELENKEIPISGGILNITDRVAALIDKNKEILGQAEHIRNEIAKLSGKDFFPELVECFCIESKKPSFWLDATSQYSHKQLKKNTYFKQSSMNNDELMSLAQFISRIIDFRSRFTSTHSSGVSAVAEFIGKLANMSDSECFELKIAGFFHDLGKLAVSNEILEKPGKLSAEEFNIMKSHTYYTYRALEAFEDLSEINKTASYHHEHLDGKGYPFGINANHLSKSARIMAVADVFTALTEDRPYREGIKNPMPILNDMACNKLDSNIVKLVRDNFDSVNETRKKAQEEASKLYMNF